MGAGASCEAGDDASFASFGDASVTVSEGEVAVPPAPQRLSQVEVRDRLGVLYEASAEDVDALFAKEARPTTSGTPRVAAETLVDAAARRGGLLDNCFYANCRDLRACGGAFDKVCKTELSGRAASIEHYPLDGLKRLASLPPASSRAASIERTRVAGRSRTRGASTRSTPSSARRSTTRWP